MSTIDYELLGGEGGSEPPAGIYDAYLARIALVTTDKGTSLVTEWQTTAGPSYYWTAWFGFTPNRLQFTQDFLQALGADRKAGMQGRSQEERDQLFEEELARFQGSVYQVRVESKGGYLNTFILDSAQVQAQSDIPADTAGLPEVHSPPPQPVGVGAQQAPLPAADDDIPF